MSVMALGICAVPNVVYADSTSRTVTLGTANPKATGDASGIMLIGDDNIVSLMQSDGTCEHTGNNYSLANGLEAYAWSNYNVDSINNACKGLKVDESISIVIVYAGEDTETTSTSYQNLVSTLNAVFPNAKVVLHLTQDADANANISLISNVDVINLRETVYTEDPVSDTDVTTEQYSAWLNKLLAHYTGSMDRVLHTEETGDISVNLKATTNTSTDTSIEATTDTTGDTGSYSSTTEGTGDSTSKSQTTGTEQGEYESSGTVTEDTTGTFNPMVTVVHSLNATFASEDVDVYYMPTLDELPMDMQAFIESGAFNGTNMYHGFAAAYMGMYDIESKTQQYSEDTVYYNTTPTVYKGVNATRALEVLGYDFMLADEECDIWVDDEDTCKAKYTTEIIPDTSIELDTVVMDIYKALGQSCYQYDYAFLPDSTLNPETSPLQKEISQALGNNGTRWDNSEGACYVFTTRTNPDVYWHKAETDRIFTTVQEKYETYSLVSPKNTPTLAEYCQLLAGMMQTYGEPVMTEEEETLLLQVYGANLPTYISDESQMDAIEYLIAKGIFNFTEKSDYKWASPLTKEDLWSTLMAVMDSDSRATFKDVQITTSAELVEANYYPVALSSELSPLAGLTYIPVDNAESAYDYLIETKYFGTADPALSCSISGTQPIKGADGSTQVIQAVKDSSNVQYVGLVSSGGRSFYHFKISSQVQDYFVLYADTFGMTIENNIGGVCVDLDTSKKSTYGSPQWLQFDAEELPIKFEPSIAKYWVDKTRVMNAEPNSDGEVTEGVEQDAFIYLDESDYVPILFEIWTKDKSKIDSCKVNGITLSGMSTAADGTSLECGEFDGEQISVLKLNTKGSKVIFQISGFKTYEACAENTNFSATGAVSKYAAFQKNSESLLVPLRYLKAMGIVEDGIQSKNCYMLKTVNSTVYIDNTNSVVINGTGVYPVSKGTKLIYTDSQGEVYIDYRAAIGWASEYLLVNEPQTASVSVTYNTNKQDDVSPKNIFGMGGDNTTVDSVTMDGSVYMVLNSLYPTANYVVIYNNEMKNGVYKDTLIVFKPKWPYWDGTSSVENTYDDTSIRTYVQDHFGISTNRDDILIYAYNLSREDNSKNPPGIIYKEKYGYLYKPSENTGSDLSGYFYAPELSKDEDENNADAPFEGPYDSNVVSLPFVSWNSIWYCINFNMFTKNGTQLPYGFMPKCMLEGNDDSVDVVAFDGHSFSDTSAVGQISSLNDVEVTPAPIGMQECLTDMVPEITATVAYEDDSTVCYYGVFRCVRETDSNGEKVLGWEGGSDAWHILVPNDVKFSVLRQTATAREVAVSTDYKVFTYDPATLTVKDIDSEEGLALGKFDWSNFNLKTLLNTTDNAITAVTAFVISVIPRLVVYICILLIALALVTNVKPWILFCDKFVDIYSILTFGRHTVHTIDMRGIFFSSMIGIGIFWLFMDGTILELFGWIVRAVVGVAVR